MKRISTVFACLLSVVLAMPAQAHGFGHGGGYGGYYGGHGYRGGWSHNWVGPVLGAAIVGSAIYVTTMPRYVVPQTVVVQQQYLPPSRVAYFCPVSQQFYPSVLICQAPWQQTYY